jgi:hypothetical protein
LFYSIIDARFWHGFWFLVSIENYDKCLENGTS